MKTSEHLNELTLALGRAQGEFPDIPKDKRVLVRPKNSPSYEYKYADLATIIKATKPVLARHGLSISQVVEVSKEGGRLTTMLLHASGQFIAGEFEFLEGGRMQETGSSITYARRYALSAILGVATDDDDDANVADGNNAKIEPTLPRVGPQQPMPGDGDQTVDPLKIQIGTHAGKHVTQFKPEFLINYYKRAYEKYNPPGVQKPGKPGDWEFFVEHIGGYVETLKQMDPEEGRE